MSFSMEKGAHYYRESVYILEEDACFFTEDPRFSGEGMSLHREKLRADSVILPTRRSISSQKLGETTSLNGERVDLKADSPATVRYQ